MLVAKMQLCLGNAFLALLWVARGYIDCCALASEVYGRPEAYTSSASKDEVSNVGASRGGELPCNNGNLARQVLDRIQEMRFGHVCEV